MMNIFLFLIKSILHLLVLAGTLFSMNQLPHGVKALFELQGGLAGHAMMVPCASLQYLSVSSITSMAIAQSHPISMFLHAYDISHTLGDSFSKAL